jgi:hypothetical protein
MSACKLRRIFTKRNAGNLMLKVNNYCGKRMVNNFVIIIHTELLFLRSVPITQVVAFWLVVMPSIW